MKDDDTEFRLAVVGGCLAVLVVIIGILLLTGVGAVFGRYLGIYNEESRRQIHQESQAHQDGMAQNLDNLCREWRSETDGTAKAGIASSIRHRHAAYRGELPDHIQSCIEEIIE